MDGPRSFKKENSDYLMILLHGYGANGDDLFSLVPYLNKSLANIAYVAPNAPFQCDLSPLGYQWFSINEIGSGYCFKNNSLIFKEIQESIATLKEFIETEKKRYSIENNKIILFGFSQGTMIALHLGRQLLPEVACIVGFSGALISFEDSDMGKISSPPIFLSHGDSDNIVNYNETIDAYEKISGSNENIEKYIESGLAHSIGNDGLAKAINFIKKHTS